MGMRFKELRIQNYGPFYGEQALSFGDKLPVVLIHGPNMTGKTSLLNAIRWVLYGRALNRFGQSMALKQLINMEAANLGNWIMSVELDFEVEGILHQLERRVQPKNPGIVPRNDNDFVEKLFLKQAGRHLNLGEIQPFINRTLPEQISRFFLFDGELLNEYETLLASAEQQASIIKESIEHILGVPALINTITDLKLNLRDAAQRQQNLARQDKAAQVFASKAAVIEAEIDTYEKDIAELQAQRDELYRQQRELDDRLESVAGIEADIQRLQDLERQIQELEEEQKRLLQENRDKLAEAWRDFLRPTIERRISILETERDKQISGFQRTAELQTKLRNVEQFLATGMCPTCGQLRSGNLDQLQMQKQEYENELAEGNFDKERFEQLAKTISNLSRIIPAHVIDSIGSNEIRLIRVRVNLADLQRKASEIDDRLKTHDKSEIARNRRGHNAVTKDLGAIEHKLLEKKRLIAGLQTDAASNRSQISKVSGPAMQRLNREVQLYEGLIDLFEQAVTRLREDLKKSVETDASEIFRHLTTDKSYQGLKINSHYGLTILDANGKEVQVRSAGAEQIVALSLIGALNKNAVRRGPVIMDTPFGRLDPQHRENILRFIPSLAEQVTLLVHGGEIDRDRDLANIKEQIDKEYAINHPSSYRSEVVAIHDLAVLKVEVKDGYRG